MAQAHGNDNQVWQAATNWPEVESTFPASKWLESLQTVRDETRTMFLSCSNTPESVFLSAFPLSTTQHFLGLTLILAHLRAMLKLYRVCTEIRVHPHTHCLWSPAPLGSSCFVIWERSYRTSLRISHDEHVSRRHRRMRRILSKAHERTPRN